MAYRTFLTVGLLASALTACGAKTPAASDAAAAGAATRAPGASACGQTDANADYRGIRVGSVVRVQEHTPLNGVANWSDDMNHYVGAATAVTELAGVDYEGCPVVHVETDGSTFYWRARDLEVLQPELGPDTTRRCGQYALAPDFGGLNVGVHVEIAEGTAWFGAANWVTDMDVYVGKSARVVELSGVDEAGCAGATLDLDKGQFFWRVRDLTRKD